MPAKTVLKPHKAEIDPKWCAEYCQAWNKGRNETKGKPAVSGRCLCLGDYCKYVGHKGEPERVK